MWSQQNRMRRSTTSVLMAGTMALVLAGCGASTASSPSAHTSKVKSLKTVGFVCFLAANAFCDTIYRGELQEAAKLHAKFGANIKILYNSPSTDTAEVQLPILSAMLARHPSAMITDVANPSEEIPALQRFDRAGIPVVEVDSTVSNPSVVDSFVGTHVFHGGELAGKSIGEHLHGHGVLGIVDIAPGIVTSNKRAEGAIAYIHKHYPGITILQTQYAGTNNPLSAENVAAAMLVAHPNITAFFGTTGVLASGIGQAVVSKGLKGKVFVQSFDAPPEVVKELKEGVISSTEVQQPLTMGQIAMKYVWDELTGHKSAVKKEVLLPTITATTKNSSDPNIAKYYYIPMKGATT